MSSGSTIVSPDKSERTFKHEAELPKLPLPKLGETLLHLKESLEPLYYADGYYQHPLDPEQIEDLSSIIKNFEKNPVSEKLQSKLQDYHDSRDCYLDELPSRHQQSYIYKRNSRRRVAQKPILSSRGRCFTKYIPS